MNSFRSWRAGSILVLVGGVLATAHSLQSGWLPAVFGATGDLAVGIGFVLAGIGIRRRYPACWMLMVMGGAWILGGLVFAAPRWVLVAVLLIVALTTVAAAIGVIARGRLGLRARWVLVLPSIATTVTAVTALVTGSPAMTVAAVATAVTPILVGTAWLFVRDEAEPALPARPAIDAAA